MMEDDGIRRIRAESSIREWIGTAELAATPDLHRKLTVDGRRRFANRQPVMVGKPA